MSWITRRDRRPAPVVPGGGTTEYATPAAYIKTTQDDYSAADRPFSDSKLEWFAEEQHEPEEFTGHIEPTYTLNRARPRTLAAEYDAGSRTLRITYREGAVYDYHGVDPEQWDDLQAERTSTGKWLARNGLAGPGSGNRVH